RTLGSPLGPDAWSLYASGRIDHDVLSLYPWSEIARASSDVYSSTADGPVERVRSGVSEHRVRAGIDGRLSVGNGVAGQLSMFAEHVGNSAFVGGASRLNKGMLVTITWAPTCAP